MLRWKRLELEGHSETEFIIGRLFAGDTPGADRALSSLAMADFETRSRSGVSG